MIEKKLLIDKLYRLGERDPDLGPNFTTDSMSGSSNRFPNYKFKKGQGPFASLATRKYGKKKFR
jgi:hypothetical protein